jgi:hypothetical protein
MRLIFFLVFFTISFVQAEQKAVVKNKRAIIYADMALEHPLGFVRQGKQISVGEVKRRRGKVLPVAVSGKIGWIKVEDISITSDSKTFAWAQSALDYQIEKEKEKVEKDPLDENNYLMFRMNQMSPSLSGASSEGGSGSVSEGASGSGFTFLFEHRHPHHRLHWGIGADYYAVKSTLANFKTLAVRIHLANPLWKWSVAHMEWFVAGLISGDFRAAVSDLGEYRGSMYGAEIGAQARFFSFSKIGLNAGFSYLYNKVNGLDAIQNADETDSAIYSVSSLKSAQVFASLSIRI